jgi:hypothetical protein
MRAYFDKLLTPNPQQKQQMQSVVKRNVVLTKRKNNIKQQMQSVVKRNVVLTNNLPEN